MSINWGPAFDAEIGYRRQQARSDFRRRSPRRKAQRVPAPVVPGTPVAGQRNPAAILGIQAKPRVRAA